MSTVYEKICEKAFNESKKIISNNLANEVDIIEITIANNIATLTKQTNVHCFEGRQNIVLQFVNECCKLINESVNITINIGLHDTYNTNLGIMVFSAVENTENIIILAQFN